MLGYYGTVLRQDHVLCQVMYYGRVQHQVICYVRRLCQVLYHVRILCQVMYYVRILCQIFEAGSLKPFGLRVPYVPDGAWKSLYGKQFCLV